MSRSHSQPRMRPSLPFTPPGPARGRRALRWAAIGLPLAGAAAYMALRSRYLLDIEQAQRRVAQGSRLAHTRLGTIEYAVIGHGPPVLFVHGAGGGFDQGLAMAHELASCGLQVITMSRFGYLRTPLPGDASPPAQADAHAALLDALGIRRAAVVGVSAGAPSALQMALRHPARLAALVLLVPALHAPRSHRRLRSSRAVRALFATALRSDVLFWAALRFAPAALVESILGTPWREVRAASPDERQRVAAMLEHILPVSERRRGLVNDGEAIDAMPGYPLERITTPALVMSVRDDHYGTWPGAREAVARLPNARFIDYERGGHLWVGHHRELLAELAAFARQPGAG